MPSWPVPLKSQCRIRAGQSGRAGTRRRIRGSGPRPAAPPAHTRTRDRGRVAAGPAKPRGSSCYHSGRTRALGGWRDGRYAAPSESWSSLFIPQKGVGSMDSVLIELGQRAVSSIAAVIGRDAEFRIALRDIATRWIDWLDAAAVPAPGMVPAAPVASAAPTAGAQPWHESTPATPAPATVEKLDAPPRQVQRMTLRIGDELVAVDAEVERA